MAAADDSGHTGRELISSLAVLLQQRGALSPFDSVLLGLVQSPSRVDRPALLAARCNAGISASIQQVLQDAQAGGLLLGRPGCGAGGRCIPQRGASGGVDRM